MRTRPAASLTWTFVVAILLLAAAAVLSLRTLQVQASADARVSHTWQVLEAIERVYGRLLQVETAQRGYLLTQVMAHLDAYRTGRVDLESEWRELVTLTADNTTQQMRLTALRPILDQRLELLDGPLLQVQQGRAAGALSLVASGQGSVLTARVRAELDSLRSEEERLLAERVTAARDAASASVAMTASLVGLAITLLFAMRQAALREHRRTERDQQRIALGEQLLSQAVRLSGLGFFEHDHMADTLYWSPRLREVHGFGVDEPPSLDRLLAQVHADDRGAMLSALAASQDPSGSGAFACEYRIRRPDGQIRWINARAQTTFEAAPLRRVRRTVGVELDVTEERATAQRLAEGAQRLSLALAAGGMGLWEWQIDTDRSYWNDEQFALLGLPATEGGAVATATFFSRVLDPDREALSAAIGRAMDDGGDFSHEFRVDRNGEVRWLAGRGRLLQGGSVRRMVGLNWDITVRKANEVALQQLNVELEERVALRTAALSDANAELQAFAHSVAHDLRAPLRNVQGYATALLDDEADRLSEEGRQYAQRLAQAAVRMDRLITDLLAWSRLSRRDAPSERVELDHVVATVRRDLAADIHRSGATIEVCAASLPAVLGHRTTIVQVLANLVANAITFVVPGTLPNVRISVERRGNKVRVEVADNGIGIAPQHHERIFGVFERLHGQERYPGTGIGLAIVRKGVERMGGRVGLHSAPAQGSRFWFELPAAA